MILIKFLWLVARPLNYVKIFTNCLGVRLDIIWLLLHFFMRYKMNHFARSDLLKKLSSEQGLCDQPWVSIYYVYMYVCEYTYAFAYQKKTNKLGLIYLQY